MAEHRGEGAKLVEPLLVPQASVPLQAAAVATLARINRAESADGNQHSLLRADLDDFISSTKSFMPEGLERDVSPSELADVIAFVQSSAPPPKKFDGNKPEAVIADAEGTLQLLATNEEVRLVPEGWWAKKWTTVIGSRHSAGSFRPKADGVGRQPLFHFSRAALDCRSVFDKHS